MRQHDGFLRSCRSTGEEDHDWIVGAYSEVSGGWQWRQSVDVVARSQLIIIGGLEFIPRHRRHAHTQRARRRRQLFTHDQRLERQTRPTVTTINDSRL